MNNEEKSFIEEADDILETLAPKRMKFSKKIVALVIILNALFTLGIFYVYLKTGTEPSTLIDRWFTFTGTELIAMAGIKIVDTLMEGRAHR